MGDIVDDIDYLVSRGELTVRAREVLRRAGTEIRDLRQSQAFGSRLTDPGTSDAAAELVAEREGAIHTVREGTHKARLLAEYGRHHHLTDAEASTLAGIHQGWKRCSDLRTGGFIAVDGEKMGDAGTPVRVCILTDKGRSRLVELGLYAPPVSTTPHHEQGSLL